MATPMRTPRGAFVTGFLGIAGGSVPILGGLGLIRGASAGVPGWVPILCGVLFVLAGVSIMLTYGFAQGLDANGELRSDAPYAIQLVQYLLILAILGAMTVVAGWIAFGPAARTFGVGFSRGGVAAGGTDRSPIGRVAFGVGACVVAAMFVYAALSGARRLERLWRVSHRKSA